jgi:hypothetical protein
MFHCPTQRSALADELLVAYDLVDRPGTHPGRERLAVRGRYKSRLLSEFAGGGSGDAPR